MALLEKAAGQGHVYAMEALRGIHDERKEYEEAVKWATKGAEAGLPKARFYLGVLLDFGKGMAAPDHPAAAAWYRLAADAGVGGAAQNLANMYSVGRGRGVRCPLWGGQVPIIGGSGACNYRGDQVNVIRESRARKRGPGAHCRGVRCPS